MVHLSMCYAKMGMLLKRAYRGQLYIGIQRIFIYRHKEDLIKTHFKSLK